MALLSLICLTALASGHPQQATWTSIKTPVGITLSTPVDLGRADESTDKDPKSTTEAYSPAAWPDCEVFVEREDFPSDENADDSLAERLTDAVTQEINLEQDKVTKISYGVQQGWPTVDIEGKLKDGQSYWYRISRSKTQHYLVGFTGKGLPDRDLMKKVLNSSKLPVEAGQGKMTQWWPDSEKADIDDAHLAFWSPITLKEDDDSDLQVEGSKTIHRSGTFGYYLYDVTYEELPNGVGTTFNDDTLDLIIKATLSQYGDKIKYDEFKTIPVEELKFRSVTFQSETLDGRVDLLVYQNRLYRFYACGMHGVLESDDLKKFFSKIEIK